MQREFPTLFDLARPERWTGGVIFASPHSGRDYPDWFLAESRLTPFELRSSEDAFVDRLIAPATRHGAVVLTARVPRALVDLNRAADEIDPRAVEGTSPGRASARVLSGLGVIPRVVAQGREIRHRPLPRAEAMRRIDEAWRPYHAALAALMDEAWGRFGQAILIDAHSMPRAALSHLPGTPPELVLGDRNGVSAGRAFSNRIACEAAAGFRIRRNSPFAGAYVLTAHGRPAERRHALQIEIDRSLYMDETTLRPHDGFDTTAKRFESLIARICRLAEGERRTDVAAE